MAGQTLGLIGFGGIAREVAQRARGLGMDLMAHDPALAAGDAVWQAQDCQALALSAVLARADILSLHVPLTAATRHLIDAPALAQMKRGAIVINTARGGVVDETALSAALISGQLGGAALDVFEVEPLPLGSPLARAPNLIATPHIAGLTEEANTRVGDLVARRVSAALEKR